VCADELSLFETLLWRLGEPFRSRMWVCENMEMVIQLFLNLGFLISWKKSELTPSQNFLFLGEHYRTDLGLIFPPEEKFVGDHKPKAQLPSI
jgi:hypothetical protein